MFWRRQQAKFLKEFKTHIELYQRVHIISYLPVSQAIGAWEEKRDCCRRRQAVRAPIDKPILLLQIELPTSIERYRWQRPGMLEAVERAESDEDWQLIFNRIVRVASPLENRDMRREIDKKILEWTIE